MKGILFVLIVLCGCDFLTPFQAFLYAKSNKNRFISKGISIESRKINPFEQLYVIGSMDVYLLQGETPSLQVEGFEQDLKCVEIEQRGDALYISFKKKGAHFNFINKKVDIFLTVNNLTEIDLDGSINLTTENEFHLDKVKITSKGATKAVLGLNVQDLNIDLKGAAHVTLNGYAQNQTINIEGSGDYKANKLLSGSANVNIYGDGSAYLDVERDLNVKMYGNGNVHYKGHPSVQSQSYGAGKVKSL